MYHQIFSLVLSSIILINKVELKPILDVEYTRASVHAIPSEIMRRVLNTNDNKVIVRGFLATQDTSNTNVIRKELNDDDVSVKTIFYDDHQIKDIMNPRVDDNVIVRTVTYSNNDKRYDKPIYDNVNVKTSYDVPLYSVEALPPVNLNEHQIIDHNLPPIDVRFADDTQKDSQRNDLIRKLTYSLLKIY